MLFLLIACAAGVYLWQHALLCSCSLPLVACSGTS